jgi:hypothetical protein
MGNPSEVELLLLIRLLHQSFFIENKNVGNKAESEDWRSEQAPRVAAPIDILVTY